jgi:hypothetical protein
MATIHARLSCLAHSDARPRLPRPVGRRVKRIRSRVLAVQSSCHFRSLGHAQFAEDRQGAVPGRAGRCRIAPGRLDPADAIERPTLPVAQAALAEHCQAPLQAAGSLLEAALLAMDLAEAVHGERLGSAVAGGACQRQALLQAGPCVLKASLRAVDLAQAVRGTRRPGRTGPQLPHHASRALGIRKGFSSSRATASSNRPCRRSIPPSP